jgi:FkbM family methyltransferase
MNFPSFRRRLFQNALDPDHLARSILRWPAWLAVCASGRPPLVRFETGGIRMRLLPRLTGFGTTSIFIKRDRYEPELLAVSRFVRPGTVVLDIGASYGIYTLFLAHFAGEHGEVLAFEPGLLSYRELERNVALNPALSGRIRLFNTAASDKAELLRLYTAGGSPVTATMGATAGLPFEEVPARRIAELVPERDHGRVSFIKIDVEGFERTALEGARPIIERSRPTIMFEVSRDALARQGLAPGDVYDFLAQFGYGFVVLDGAAFRMALAPREGNVFAVPPGPADPVDRLQR